MNHYRHFILLLLLFTTLMYAKGQAPVISSFSPLAGPVGTTVTITGNNFSSTPANNIVFFGAVKANVISATTTSLLVNAPAGATYQPLTVTVNQLTGYSDRPFSTIFSAGPGFATVPLLTQSFAASTLPFDVAVADMDGDGKPDVISSNSGANTISVFRNITFNDTIKLSPRIDFGTGLTAKDISIADYNGDGKPDVAVINSGAASISIFKNTSSPGNISFEPKVDVATGVDPSMLSAADIDGDGKTDIVVSNKSSNTISILKNTTTTSLSFSKTDLPAGNEPSCVRIADMNGDKKPDIIVSDYASANLSVFGNNSLPGSVSLAAAVQFSTGALHPYWITIADLDGDGKNDILASLDSLPVLIEDQQSPIKVFRNNGTGTNFSFMLVNGFPYHIASVRTTVGDINGDGKPDVALPFSGDHWSVFVKNESISGNISFSQNFEEYQYAGVNSFPVTISMGDLNADGKPDAIIAAGDGFNQDYISIQKNNFWQGPDIIGSYPYSGTVGDTITITGSNFDNATSVSFAGTAAASFTVISSTVIKAVVNRGSSGNITVTTPFGVSRYFEGYVFPFTYTQPQPKITSIDPNNGAPGDTIHIYGHHFIDINSVTFGGVPAQSFIVHNKNHIGAVIGAGASGDIKVANSFNADSVAGFTFYTIRPPVISSFFPGTVTTDDTITIKGRYLTGASYVRLGGAPAASYNIVSDSVIKAVVGAYNNMPDVYLETPGGSAFLPGYSFYTHPPVFNAYSPTTGDSGTIVIIKGKFLSEVNAVSFGGTPAQFFTIINDTIIKATVGNGSGGAVSVTNITSTVSLPGFTFIPTVPPPVISSFAPLSGNTGTSVVINGVNFSSTAADNAVFFGAVKAAVLTASSTALTVTVPPGASYAPITVTVLPNRLTAFSNKIFSPVFPNADTLAPFIFKQEQDLVTAGDPRKSAIGDFDGDGKADIAVTNFAAGTVSVFKNVTVNTNAVAFNNKIDFTTGGSPFGITASDINGDGKPDLIITHFAAPLVTTSIGVLKNTSTVGNISFAAETYLPIDIETQYRYTVTRDWDGNGKPDVAATDFVRYINPGAPVSVFKNAGSAGNISFSPLQDVIATTYNLDVICAGDIDGDGKTDLVVNGRYNKSVAILKNNSSGNIISFTQAGTYPIGYEPGGMALGDVDGDGKPDVAITLMGYNVFSIFRNTSTPGVISFAARADFNTGPNQEDIVLTDLDGDNKPDVALTNRYYTTVHSLSVYKNKSTPGLPAFEFKNNFNTGTGPVHLNAGDLNNDGKPELITVNSLVNTVAVFRNRVGSPPVINAVTPSSGGEAAVITITGENFYNISSVSFGNTPAASFTIESDSVIKAVLGNGNSGIVNIIAPSGNGIFAGFTFLSPRFVTQTGAGLKNGSSWTNAWGAVEFADNLYNQQAGTSIWVAKGTYRPTKDSSGTAGSNNLLSFFIPQGVRLYGGFAGTENSLAQRIIPQLHGVNASRLSGDIGTLNVQGDNCQVAVTMSNSGQNETLDGFTISNAKNNAVKIGFRATVVTAPTIKNCIISDNAPDDAALLVNGNGSAAVKPLIRNCVFTNNHSLLYGAALLTGNCRPVFENCIFYNNGKTAAGTGASGITFAAAAGTLLNCNFYENATNHAAANGAAIVLSNASDSVYINNSIFWNNYNSDNVNNLSVSSGSNLASVKNCLFQTQTTGTAPAVLVSSISANPEFVNPADADGTDNTWGTGDDGMIPLAYSAVKDKGSNAALSSTLSTDINGNARVSYNTVDIGAYEVQNGFIEICPGGNAVLKTLLSGSNYQWQLNTGSGYNNISNSNHYFGSNSNTLLLDAIPSSWYNYTYRCHTDSNYSDEFILHFTDTWTGAVNNSWENTGNWSCGLLPDANCDVIISLDTAVVNSNTAVKSLSVRQGAALVVNAGYSVTVTGGMIATGTLGGSPGSCTPVIMNGVYRQGLALTASNTIQVQVNVISPGSYFISTSTANGVNFSKAGNFDNTGIQQVILEGSGTPEFYGTHHFTVQFNNSSCDFAVNFIQAAPDYFPIVTNSWWTYKPSGTAPGAADSLYKKCLANTVLFNGQSYRQFAETNEFLSNYSMGYRKSNNAYYQYLDHYEDLHSLLFLQVNGAIKFLDDNLTAGGTWVNNITGWVNGGSTNTPIQVQGTMLEKNASVTLTTGLSFSNVTKVRLLYFEMSVPGSPNIVYAEDRWYALGAGLIYYSSSDPFGPCLSYSLKRYQVY